MNHSYLHNLVRQLVAFPQETEWVEFKHNRSDPQEIGEYISALANSATLIGKQRAYILWGVQDGSHEILGTTFSPKKSKVGNQELESWLVLQLDPHVDVRIHEDEIEGKHLVLFEIIAAINRPIRFRGIEYIRIGGITTKLQECPEKERELWRIFEQVRFEKGIAMKGVSAEQVVALIDCSAYFNLMQLPFPENRSGILQRLISEKMLIQGDDGSYDITNVGAILFGRNIEEFGHFASKVLRVITYRGDQRIDGLKEQRFNKGYAVSFNEAIDYINDRLPQNEEIGQAFRKVVRMYPPIAVRELVANALIHQDFTVIGAGPMVEIFSNRIEISNPGLPLIDPLRFIDEPPISRNEILANLMRRLNICEQRGSGVDKAIFEIELFQLPALDFRVTTKSMITVLYGPRQLRQMDSSERTRACYQHACLQYVIDKKMNNESLRKRLGINPSSYPLASRIIRDAIQAKLIKPYGDVIGSGKSATYIPFWA